MDFDHFNFIQNILSKMKISKFISFVIMILVVYLIIGSGQSRSEDPMTIEVRVLASTDDAEEDDTGSMSLTSSDLELVLSGSNQTVGMRFNGIGVPQGATITNAYIQFQVDETSTVPTTLTIQAEAIDDAPTFSSTSGDISFRSRTVEAVNWTPATWTVVGEAGPDQMTPDISWVIQEIVDRGGWISGNSIVIIITGEGKRTAESFNGVQAAAPLLHVEYTASGNQLPAATVSAPAHGSIFFEGDSITFTGMASDFEEGDLTASLAWESDLDGPIGNGGSFSRSNLSVGVHTIMAMVTDTEGRTAFDSTTIAVSATGVEVFVGAGDIADCTSNEAEETAKLLDNIPGTVYTVGDNAYPNGTTTEFNDCYEPTWGRHKAWTHPAVGDNEYNTPGASPYFNYFGAAAGDPNEGYYSYDVGSWHIIVLNSNCSQIGGCGPNDPQGQWLQADLAANPSMCILAIHHEPLFSSNGGDADLRDFWVPLYEDGADIVLSGHRHMYERFAQQNPDGVADPGRGIRQFVVGTGPIAGQTFTDSGSTLCVTSSFNQPPVANDDSASTNEDTAIIIQVTANDSDPDGNLDPTSVKTACATCAEPANGALVNNGYGTFNYMPNPDYNGNDSFVYEICDTGLLCDTAIVSITVNPANDPPVANNDSASMSEYTAVAIDVAANDSDPDGNLDPTTANTTCTSCTDPTNGTLVNNEDGTFAHTPDPGFNGSDSFVYEICDTGTLCDTAMVNITVTPTNDPPVANGDSAIITEDTAVIIDVAANDSDPDGNLDPTTANSTCANGSTGCNGSSNGSLSDNGDGAITYTTDPDFNGSDSFVYEICDTRGLCDTAAVSITVDPVNDPPVANGNSASTPEDTAVTIDVAANDTDPDGDLDPTSANSSCVNGSSGCNGAANGTLVNNGDGTFYYTPDTSFSGTDSFVYEICDTGGLCDTAAVSITVNPLAPDILEVRIASSSDDAEERADGRVKLTSSDLELVFDGGGHQTVGMRFNGLTIPPAANIAKAYIQFQVDETIPADPTNLTIQGEDVDNAATFTAVSGSITSRPRTTAAMSWAPVPWTTVGAAGPDQQTPDITAVIQEIVDRAGWTSGNSLVIIFTGNGERTAEAYDGVSAAAPLLHVEYSIGPPGNQAPSVTAEVDQSVIYLPSNIVSLSGTLTDDGLPIGSTVTTEWSQVSGPADVIFGYIYAIDTTATFPVAGTYTLRLTADDTELTGYDEVTVEVRNPPVLTDIVVEPDPATVRIGDTQQFIATGLDQDGNAMPITPLWDAIGGGIDANGLYTAGLTPGDYSVTATDGAIQGIGTVTVTDAITTLEVRVIASTDDAEERVSGSVKLSSSDLELVYDRAGNQMVGMRFNGLTIPSEANIARAYIQFQVDDTIPADPTDLTIQGEDADNALTFTTATNNISSRPRTTTGVSWSPIAWTTVGEAGPDQQTPNIASVVQEIVNRPGWVSGNSLVVIITGTGERTAEAYDGKPAAAPLLHVEYTVN
jgi:hypothetical protein